MFYSSRSIKAIAVILALVFASGSAVAQEIEHIRASTSAQFGDGKITVIHSGDALTQNTFLSLLEMMRSAYYAEDLALPKNAYEIVIISTVNTEDFSRINRGHLSLVPPDILEKAKPLEGGKDFCQVHQTRFSDPDRPAAIVLIDSNVQKPVWMMNCMAFAFSNFWDQPDLALKPPLDSISDLIDLMQEK